MSSPSPGDRPLLLARRKQLVTWGRIQLVLVALLSAGLAVTILGAFARYTPLLDQLRPLAIAVASFVSTLTGALGLAYLLVNRILGIIEIDLLGILVGATNSGQSAKNSQ